jgi:methylphosphotriester-DNA--protein-cysteine methyltransferase
MNMPSYDSAYERARDKQAFSNGSEAEAWKYRHCTRCRNDDEDSCPLLGVVFAENRTPAEWVEAEPGSFDNQYDCTLFSPAA